MRRAGDTLSTPEVLAFQTAHAMARDAVRAPLDVASVSAALTDVGLGVPGLVAAAAADRDEYLRRPDLGRVPEGPLDLQSQHGGIGFVIADGLSPGAITEHAAPLCRELIEVLGPDYAIAAPVIATQARVALGDHIGQALGVDVVIVIIGERPGLSVIDSVGMYLTYAPQPGRVDSERNCVSNIHPPDGLGYRDAARVSASLIAEMRRLGCSGVAVKVRSMPEALSADSPLAIEPAALDD